MPAAPTEMYRICLFFPSSLYFSNLSLLASQTFNSSSIVNCEALDFKPLCVKTEKDELGFLLHKALKYWEKRKILFLATSELALCYKIKKEIIGLLHYIMEYF